MTKITTREKIIICIFSALAASVFCAAVWAMIGIYPGSARTLLNSDMESQYVSFFESLRSVISGENSLFYNWSLYLGNNYWGHYAYYLASPWSWFLLLWKTKKLTDAIYFMSLIKIGLCGLTFSCFLLNRPIKIYSVSIKNEKLHKIAVVVFSMCYALMSYNMLYVNTPMWIDTVYMLPLVILGLERIIAGKRGVLYFVTLTLTIIFNFYTAFMAAVFTIIYFVYYYLYVKNYVRDNPGYAEQVKLKRSAFIRYVLNSLAAVGVSLFVLVPTVYGLMQGKLEDDTTNFYGMFTYPLWKLIIRFFDSSYTSITNEGLPSVFCTSFCVIFSVFFIVKGLKKSAKVSAILISVFWVISMWIVPINRIWTGFRDPIWFPFRYAFVISFFFVLLGYEGFAVFVEWKFKYKKPIYGMWAVLTVFELFLSVNQQRVGIIREIGAATLSTWEGEYTVFEPLARAAEKIEASDPDSTGFYRIDKSNFYTFNDAMLYSYHGVQSFSSVFNKEPLHFLKKMGFKQDDYELYQMGNTIVSDSVIGVKYLMEYIYEDERYISVAQNRMMNLYENPYALSLGFMVEGSLNDIEFGDNAFDNQNLLLSEMTDGKVEAYYAIDFDTELISYQEVTDSVDKDAKRPTELTYPICENRKITIEAIADGHIFLYTVFDEGNHDATTSVYNNFKQFYLNGENYDSIQYGCYNYIMDLGTYKKGDVVTFIITNCTPTTKVYAAGENTEAVDEALTLLGNNPKLRDISISKGNMTAKLNADRSGTMFLSVPYDKGWSLYVDGVECDIEKAFGTFCSFNVAEGNHIIEMRYVSPYFVVSSVVSAVCLMAYAGIQIFISFRKKRKNCENQ